MSNALLQTVIGAYQSGQDNRRDRERRNALSDFDGTPGSASAVSANLFRLGETTEARNALGYGTEANALNVRQQAGPLAGSGDFRGAASKAAAGGETELASQFMQMDEAQLRAARERGERGASALYAALQLPAPGRAAYMAQHRELALGAGITPEQFEAFDWSNDGAVRAAADKWLQASKAAGEVQALRLGDTVQPIRVSPRGVEPAGAPMDIPETRQERLQRDEFGYRKEQDTVDNRYREGRAEAEDAFRKWQMENSDSRSDVEGRVLQKAVTDGTEALSPAERAIYDRYIQGGQPGGFGMMPGLPGAAPQQPSAAPPTPARVAGPGSSAQSPAQVTSEAEFEQLPPGAWFINPADGQAMQKAR